MTLPNLTILLGKTFSGKSTYIDNHPEYKQIKTHTTRPIRDTETGNEYYFEKEDTNSPFQVSKRVYKTAFGLWAYWMQLDDLNFEENNIIILDLEGTTALLDKIVENYGEEYLNKISILYKLTPLKTLIDRMKNSSRGENESLVESIRRLASDNEVFADVETYLEYSRESKDQEVYDITDYVIHRYLDEVENETHL